METKTISIAPLCFVIAVGRYVDVDLTAVQTELTKAYDAATDIITDGTKGKATVHEEDLASLPNLVIPSDYMYCDKSWYDVYLSRVLLVYCTHAERV